MYLLEERGEPFAAQNIFCLLLVQTEWDTLRIGEMHDTHTHTLHTHTVSLTHTHTHTQSTHTHWHSIYNTVFSG